MIQLAHLALTNWLADYDMVKTKGVFTKTQYVRGIDYWEGMTQVLQQFVGIGAGSPQLALSLLTAHASWVKESTGETIDELIQLFEDIDAMISDGITNLLKDRYKEHIRWRDALSVMVLMAANSGTPKSLLDQNPSMELLRQPEEIVYRANLCSTLMLWAFKNKTEAQSLLEKELSLKLGQNNTYVPDSLVERYYILSNDLISQLQAQIGPLPDIPATLLQHPSIAPHLPSNRIDKPLSETTSDDSEHFLRAREHMEAQEFPEAVEAFTSAIEINPAHADAWNERGNAVRRMEGDINDALADYTKAIELEPHRGTFYFNRAVAYDDEGDYDDWELAIQDYTAAIAASPLPLAHFYDRRGSSYYLRKRLPEALADYTTIIEKNAPLRESPLTDEEEHEIYDLDFLEETKPSHHDYFQRAMVYESMEKWTEAIADHTKVIEMKPYPGISYLLRAIAYAKSARLSEAMEDLDKYNSSGPGANTIKLLDSYIREETSEGPVWHLRETYLRTIGKTQEANTGQNADEVSIDQGKEPERYSEAPEVLPNDSSIICPACNHTNPLTDKFCGKCGMALPASCPSCKATIQPQSQFCGQCGARKPI